MGNHICAARAGKRQAGQLLCWENNPISGRTVVRRSCRIKDGNDYLWNMSRAALPALYPPQCSKGLKAARLEILTTRLLEAQVVLLVTAPLPSSPSALKDVASGSVLGKARSSAGLQAPKSEVKRDESQRADVTLRSTSDFSLANEGSSCTKLMWPREPALLTSTAREYRSGSVQSITAAWRWRETAI